MINDVQKAYSNNDFLVYHYAYGDVVTHEQHYPLSHKCHD